MEELGRSFGSIADLYDAIRPGYPPTVVERVLGELGNISKADVLVGCGSGQATRLFAPSGARILATDLSADLVALAKKRLASFPNVQFGVSEFEKFESSIRFDLVFSAQAFHWIATKIGLPKAASLLKPRAPLALFWNFFRYDGNSHLEQIRDAMIRYMPLFGRYPEASDTEFNSFAAQWVDELNASGLYQDVRAKTIWSEKEYSRVEFLTLVSSYSWFQTQTERVHSALMDKVSALFGQAPSRAHFPVRTLLVMARRDGGKVG